MAKRKYRPASPRGRAGTPDSASPLFIYGAHAVRAAWRNPSRQITHLWTGDSRDPGLGPRPNGREVPHTRANRRELEQLLPPGAVHQGIVVEATPLAVPDLSVLGDTEASSGPVLVLDQVTDPQNVGAILRSAAAFSAAAVIVTQRHAPPESGALAKAASGALEMVPLIRVVNLARALGDLADLGYWRVGLAGDADTTLAAADCSPKTALILGAEGGGLRRLTRDHCDQLVRLPIAAEIDSLNVSNAAAVALYELARNKG